MSSAHALWASRRAAVTAARSVSTVPAAPGLSSMTWPPRACRFRRRARRRALGSSSTIRNTAAAAASTYIQGLVWLVSVVGMSPSSPGRRGSRGLGPPLAPGETESPGRALGSTPVLDVALGSGAQFDGDEPRIALGGVASNGTHPKSWKYTSVQACRL